MGEDVGKLTFLSKKPTECPVCEARFPREELHTGRGRLIAGDLSDELRRNYEPSLKYGEVYPLVYPLAVCPECLYTAFPADFGQVPPSSIPPLKDTTGDRQRGIRSILPDLDFTRSRTLKEGAGSYFLALQSYDHFPATFSPTIKQGLCALRGAWLFSDLHKKYSNDNYDYISRLFYRKAAFFYTRSIENEGSGKETVAEAANLGPDLDKNYGYDGVMYLAALLEYKYGPRTDREARVQSLINAKRIVARIFGMGKASKDKPAALLNNAKDLYTRLGEELAGDDEADEQA